METVAVESSMVKTSFTKLWGASGISNLADGVGLSNAPSLAATLNRGHFLVSGFPCVYPPELPYHQHRLVQEIREGIVWFWNHRLLRTLGFFARIFNFVSAATMINCLQQNNLISIKEYEFITACK
jgi:hypothetical protein